MARTYYNSTNATYSQATEIQTSKPFDTRIVADTFNDLLVTTAAGYKYAYTGLVVYVIDEKCQYVYTGTSGKPADIKNSEKWVKLQDENSSSEFNPAEYLSYYQEKLGAVIVDTADDLTSDTKITNAYKGMFAVVKDDLTTSENEGGLYVLLDTPNTSASNWQKVVAGTGSGDVSSIITTDGTTPTSGTGISINNNDSDASIQEEYVYTDTDVTSDNDNTFVSGIKYTSRGLQSTGDNPTDYTDINWIMLYKGSGLSYIKLFSTSNDNWLELHIEDDTLGLSQDDVTVYSTDSEVPVWENNTLVLPKETFISINKNYGFTGMNEFRSDNNSYIFGTTGSKYEDVDIYSESVLPTAYIYSSNGTVIKVLTEADQPQSISDAEIASLFDE